MPTDCYAVIGHPVAHSKSPLIHRLFAQACQQNLRYDAIDGGPDEVTFLQALNDFIQAGGRGMNVTLPFKLAALRAADVASEDARLAGAANTLKFAQDGRIHAHNTDGLGLVRDIEHNLKIPLRDAKVLLLGAGGASRGVLLPLARAGVASIHIANRTPDKAFVLAQELQAHLNNTRLSGTGLDALGNTGVFDVLINATSASLGGEMLQIPSGIFSARSLIYDMFYGQGLTPFLLLGQEAGCHRLADGSGMLVEQAAESFAWWRGVRPDTQQVLQRLRAALQ